jgi:hypothetical protein
MEWRKSSYSAENGNCAEAAVAAGSVLVRDTQDRGGITLTIPSAAWLAFTGTFKD